MMRTRDTYKGDERGWMSFWMLVLLAVVFSVWHLGYQECEGMRHLVMEEEVYTRLLYEAESTAPQLMDKKNMEYLLQHRNHRMPLTLENGDIGWVSCTRGEHPSEAGWQVYEVEVCVGNKEHAVSLLMVFHVKEERGEVFAVRMGEIYQI